MILNIGYFLSAPDLTTELNKHMHFLLNRSRWAEPVEDKTLMQFICHDTNNIHRNIFLNIIPDLDTYLICCHIFLSSD